MPREVKSLRLVKGRAGSSLCLLATRDTAWSARWAFAKCPENKEGQRARCCELELLEAREQSFFLISKIGNPCPLGLSGGSPSQWALFSYDLKFKCWRNSRANWTVI